MLQHYNCYLFFHGGTYLTLIDISGDDGELDSRYQGENDVFGACREAIQT